MLQWLNPKTGELILDLGCGTGQLTAKIAEFGAEVMGIDSATTMIEKARQNYPYLRFEVVDARNFQIIEEYLKPTLYQDGGWTADYRRIRILATKV